jgi:hypothetical protein
MLPYSETIAEIRRTKDEAVQRRDKRRSDIDELFQVTIGALTDQLMQLKQRLHSADATDEDMGNLVLLWEELAALGPEAESKAI